MKRLVRLSSTNYSLIQAKEGLLLLIDNKTEPKAGDTSIALGGTWNGTITQITGEPVTFGWKKIVASNDINSITLKNVHKLIIENVHVDKIYSEEDIRKAINIFNLLSDNERIGSKEYNDLIERVIQSLGKKEFFIYIDQPNNSDHLNEEDWDLYHTMYEQSNEFFLYDEIFDWSINEGNDILIKNFSKIVTDNNTITLIYK
jgi:hypothetical protein